MITFFRNFFNSKLGIPITLAFLGLIAFAFAAADVGGSSMFGGVAGGDRVAVVGDRTVTSSDLIINTNSAARQAREQDPALSIEGFVADGGLDDVLEQMIRSYSIAEFGREMGLRVSGRLLDSEIASIPGYTRPDGSFDMAAFREVIRQRGLTEALVREDFEVNLFARQLVVPAASGAALPDSIVRRYAELSNERRIGRAAALPASAYAPTGAPEAEELQAYYQTNRGRYVRPERRVLRYAEFGPDALTGLPPVTNAQIAERYRRDAEVYAESEERSFTQLVVPTQAAAQAIIDEVNGGVSLAASARSKGLDTVSLENVDQAELAAQSSAAVAEAAFAAEAGALAGPVRGSLGFYVLEVGNVRQIAGRSLAQASGAIRDQLTQERRAAALLELTESLENDFEDGLTLAQAAQRLRLEVQSTRPLTATGQVFGSEDRAPEAVTGVVPFAFQLQEGDSQIFEAVPGERFVLFQVADVAPSALPPLAQVREEVTGDWRRDEGLTRARAAAGRVMERVEGGSTLAAAIAAEDVSLAAPLPLNLTREELLEQGGLSRASILFFSMAQGTIKRVENRDTASWFVVQLDSITPANLEDGSPLLAQVTQQLAGSLEQEYAAQFVTAMQDAMDVEINESSVEAVRAGLLNTGN